MYSATHLPAGEGEGRESYSVFTILKLYLSSHIAYWTCIIYTDWWFHVLKTSNWLRVWLPLTLKNSLTSANNRNWAITTCFSCVQSTTWSLWWQADHIAKSIIQRRHLTVILTGRGHMRQRKPGMRLTLKKKRKAPFLTHQQDALQSGCTFYPNYNVIFKKYEILWEDWLSFETVSWSFTLPSTNIRTTTGKG